MGSKTASLDSVEMAETAVSAEPAAVNAAKVNAVSPNTRMGVVRYLQLKKDLSSGFKRVMRNKYASEVHTYAEWEELLEYTLNRVVK